MLLVPGEIFCSGSIRMDLLSILSALKLGQQARRDAMAWDLSVMWPVSGFVRKLVNHEKVVRVHWRKYQH